MDTASSFTMADSPIRHKRARVSRACDQCRRKKIRCDADKSTPCTNCRTYGFGCSFLDSAKKRGPPKGYIEALENRLKRMEGLLGGLVDGVDKGTRPKKNSNRDVEDERRRRRRVDDDDDDEEGGDDEEEEEEEDAEEDQDDEDDNDSASSSHSSRGRGLDYRRQRRRNEALSTNKVSPLTGVEFGKYQHLSALTSPPQTPEEVVDDLNENLEKLDMEDYTQIRYVGSSSGLQLLTPQFEQKDGIFKLPQMKKPPSLPDLAQDVQIKKEPGCGDADVEEDLEPDLGNLKRRLVDIYFAKVHVIYPIINKLHFLKQFHGDLSTRPHQSLTFAMLAIASRYLPEDELEGKPETIGQMFFERARDSLDQIYMHPRVSTVQALVLLSLYQNGVAEADRHWLDCGLAIRMAQELGLHRSSSKWKIPRSEIEARKRLWWTCFVMDRWFGATYGRPLVISEDDCDVEYPSINEEDDDEISTPLSRSDDSFSPEPLLRSSPPTKKPMYKAFLEIVKISVILGRVLQALYTPKARKRRSANEKIVKGLDDELAAWSTALPHELQWQKEDSHNVVSSPIIGSINLCYYTIVILIHRPHIPSNKSSGLRSVFPLRTCTSAATNITKIAQCMNANNYFNLTWPFSVYNLFQSSLIHMYNDMSLNQETTRTASSALASNVQILDDLKHSSFPAYKLSLLLGALSKKEVNFDEPSEGGFWVKVNPTSNDPVPSGAHSPKQSSKTLSTRSSYPSYTPASERITSPIIDHRQHNRYSTSNANTAMTTNADVTIPLPVPPHVLSHTSLPMSSPSSNLVTLQPEPAFSLRPFAFASQPEFQRPVTQPPPDDNMSFALDSNGGNGEMPNEYFRVDQSNPFYAMPSTYNVEDWDVWMVEHGSTGTMNVG